MNDCKIFSSRADSSTKTLIQNLENLIKNGNKGICPGGENSYEGNQSQSYELPHRNCQMGPFVVASRLEKPVVRQLTESRWRAGGWPGGEELIER